MENSCYEYKWDCFIAYAASDKNVAEALYDLLHSDFRVFLDARSLQLGDDWDLRLREAQQSSLITVVLISPNTDRAYYQREEIAAAIALARTGTGRRVVPVYLNTEAALSDSIPYGLRLKHGITLSDSVGLGELCNALLRLRGELQGGPAGDGITGFVRPTPTRLPDAIPVSDLSMALGIANSEYHITSRSASSLQIRPSWGYLEEFHAGGPIESGDIPLFFGVFPNLDFKIVNNGNKTLFLTELCFEISSSRLDPRPVLIIKEDRYGGNALHFGILNEGWGSVCNLRARFHLTPLGAEIKAPENCEPYTYEVLVGDFSESTNVDIGFAFREAGVDLEGLCSRNPIEEFLGFRRMEHTKFLGEFRRNAGIVTGELVYEALSLEGETREHRVKFTTIVHVINENREGAAAPPSFQYNVKFEVDRSDYERRVQISHVLKPGEADRFNIAVGMDKSSLHSFTAKLIYNNGDELSSPVIELLGFIPRSITRYPSRISAAKEWLQPDCRNSQFFDEK